MRTRSIAFMHYGLRRHGEFAFFCFSQHRRPRSKTMHERVSARSAPTEECRHTALAIVGEAVSGLVVAGSPSARGPGSPSARGPGLASAVRPRIEAYSSWHSRHRKCSGGIWNIAKVRGAAFMSFVNECSNPSIEGTSTIRLRLLAAAPHVKR